MQLPLFGDNGADPPYAADSDTSKDAADSVRGFAHTQRGQVYAFVEGRGDFGATCDEIEIGLGGSHQAISARLWELRGNPLYSHRRAVLYCFGRRPTRTGRMADVHLTRDH
jgi:hypothetical protein